MLFISIIKSCCAKLSSYLGLSISIIVLIAYVLLLQTCHLDCLEFCGNLGNGYNIGKTASNSLVYDKVNIADYVIIDRSKRSPSEPSRSAPGQSSGSRVALQPMNYGNRAVHDEDKRLTKVPRRRHHPNNNQAGQPGHSQSRLHTADSTVVSHKGGSQQHQDQHQHQQHGGVGRMPATHRGYIHNHQVVSLAETILPTIRQSRNTRLCFSRACGEPAQNFANANSCNQMGPRSDGSSGGAMCNELPKHQHQSGGGTFEESSGILDDEPKSRTIETAVFIDQALDTKFNGISNGLVELNKLVLTIMNQVQYLFDYSSLQLPIKLKLVLIEHLKESERQLGLPVPNTERGDIDAYLSNFCNWQKGRLSRETRLWWDHAILLSGLDLYKITPAKNYSGVLGLAWVGGMCKGNYSCTINEATNFESAFVIAHEIGHSLGIMHDGQKNRCDPNSYIMSERTGAGKVHWSKCSNNYLNESIQRGQLGCLESEQNNQIDSLYDLTKLRAPGQVYTINEQCKWAFGGNYTSHVTHKSPFNAVCRELWCVSGTWAKAAHPALEGSACGDQGRVCREGKCVRSSS